MKFVYRVQKLLWVFAVANNCINPILYRLFGIGPNTIFARYVFLILFFFDLQKKCGKGDRLAFSKTKRKGIRDKKKWEFGKIECLSRPNPPLQDKNVEIVFIQSSDLVLTTRCYNLHANLA